MNTKEYISSGVIESYVLGLATAEDKLEFEQMCRQYPEVTAARDAFEMVLEKQLLKQAVAIPDSVRQRLMDTIRTGAFSTEAKLLSMDNTNQTKSSSPARWVAAASIILLLGAAYFAYDFYNKNQKLQTSNKDMQARVEKMEEEKKWMDEVQSMMSNPNVAVVNLVGTTPAKASADIYWDTTSASNVYMVVKNMPKLPSDQQYQLWSLINGPDGQLQPTSRGLFDMGDGGKVILKMDNTQKADAFAITIEKRGNTGGPNLQQLQSMGKTKL